MADLPEVGDPGQKPQEPGPAPPAPGRCSRAVAHRRRLSPRGHRGGHTGSQDVDPGTEVVSVEAVAPLVVLVALPVSIALFGWLIYRLLRPGGRR
jgi:hypothetical protein